MARIRTVKPEFFRHEGLQDLEKSHKGKNAMLVFIGLWGHCDKGGKFEWRPRQLKLDILPFLDFDMEATLGLLHSAGFLERYEISGKQYGRIPTFKDHQRVGGKEAQEPDRFPDASPGSVSEAPEKHIPSQEGKGREGNKEGNGSAPRVRGGCPCPADWIPADAWLAFVEHRASKRAKLTAKAVELIVKDLDVFRAGGVGPRTVLEFAIKNGHTGLYYKPDGKPAANGHAVVAWGEFRKASSEGRKPASWSHPQTEAALEAIGGWQWARNAQSRDIDFKQRQFEAAFYAARA